MADEGRRDQRLASAEAAPVPPEGPVLIQARQGAVRTLARSFFARPPAAVARDLLGRYLVRVMGDERLIGRIVECEAYREDDPASHSYRGRTARTEVMFGHPGHLYVYFTYGMHFCMNVVTGRDGEGSAVLLRAVEPLAGMDRMAELRGVRGLRDLCRGPGRLTQAFGVTRAQNGTDLVAGPEIYVARGRPLPDSLVGVSPRVGIRIATERPWRFYEKGSAFVSGRRGG